MASRGNNVMHLHDQSRCRTLAPFRCSLLLLFALPSSLAITFETVLEPFLSLVTAATTQSACYPLSPLVNTLGLLNFTISLNLPSNHLA